MTLRFVDSIGHKFDTYTFFKILRNGPILKIELEIDHPFSKTHTGNSLTLLSP